VLCGGQLLALLDAFYLGTSSCADCCIPDTFHLFSFLFFLLLPTICSTFLLLVLVLKDLTLNTIDLQFTMA